MTVGANSIKEGAAADEALPPVLQEILDDSEPTPAGRSFYPADDQPMREAARTLAQQPGYYVVDIHGTADRAKVGPTWLDADQLAALIRETPDWQGQPVFLMSCDTGRRDDGFAQQLATSLRVDVTAPDKLAWSDFEPGGGAQPYSSDGCLDGFGIPRPIKPPTGTFVTFSPAEPAQLAAGDGRAAELGSGTDQTALGLLHRRVGAGSAAVADRDVSRPPLRSQPGRRQDMGDQLRGG
ncbi:hypothetical protein [Microlunatus soli]|uniref:Uncharacterized protein n=1 Tax=Microlunatus soli TaxID=630515 RepID=A0A1H1T0L5_9ACTN|nr:hypothetical protein [Microlunatus soli]SDS53797.1 hypothetical protein SAMN04489812_2210 [Microlunatus soli]